MKKIIIGILAHVDAGKTTLSEALLYMTAALRKKGRVDNGDAFLDTDAQEKDRGITIFSKQAEFRTEETSFTLLDTPGHVDFSAEMERTLQVLDYAILVISGTDGVQSHTETLWQLLKRYEIPTFIFVNKMDLPNRGEEELLAHLRAKLDDGCASPDLEPEQAAMGSEELMEYYLEHETLSPALTAKAVAARQLFPVWFGSALRISDDRKERNEWNEALASFLKGLDTLTVERHWPQDFGAKVYKITHDSQGARLTWMKITGGSLKAKAVLTDAGTPDRKGNPVAEEDAWSEKADQLRIYSGTKFTLADSVPAGSVCAVTGLTRTFPGQGLGIEKPSALPILEPVLNYRVLLQRGTNPGEALKKLKELEEEDPQLHLLWDEEHREISLQLMGEVQLEVLQKLIRERFGFSVQFDEGSILYKETITAPVEGVGHFEPLRHYAEVHLLLEPGERGSGLVFDTDCSLDKLDLNWQRLILTHLEEKIHRGVLTGSPITDMKITLVAGRAHVKHTEGGDFRQATYRAVRQGLMCAPSILLEPWYDYRLELPGDTVGRAMSDLQQLCGTFGAPELEGENAILTGTCPVSTMRSYQTEVTAYTKGRGHLTCTLRGYEECHNTDEVLAAAAYDPEADLNNTPDSVFCSHGAGTIIPWYMVPDYMHLEALPLGDPEPQEEVPSYRPVRKQAAPAYRGTLEEDKELQAIFEQTYGAIPKRSFRPQAEVRRGSEEPAPKRKAEPVPTGPEYLLVDGYNIIFAWEELKAIAKVSLDSARERLTDILCNYRGYRQCELILVFDAYKVKHNPGSVEKRDGISIVYTKEAETADSYIEKVTYELGKKHRVRVATSDGLEQVIILGHGALRQSAESFRLDVEQATGEIAKLVQLNNLKPVEKRGGAIRVTKKKEG